MDGARRDADPYAPCRVRVVRQRRRTFDGRGGRGPLAVSNLIRSVRVARCRGVSGGGRRGGGECSFVVLSPVPVSCLFTAVCVCFWAVFLALFADVRTR